MINDRIMETNTTVLEQFVLFHLHRSVLKLIIDNKWIKVTKVLLHSRSQCSINNKSTNYNRAYISKFRDATNSKGISSNLKCLSTT